MNVLAWHDFVLRLGVAILAGARIGLEPNVTAVRWQAINEDGHDLTGAHGTGFDA